MFIGRKSVRPLGESHLSKGKTRAVFHAEGNVEVVIEKLNNNRNNMRKNYFKKLKRKPIRSHSPRSYTHNSSKNLVLLHTLKGKTLKNLLRVENNPAATEEKCTLN
jgi:hypothetical protein